MSTPNINQNDVMPMRVLRTLLKVVAAQGHDVDELVSNIGLDCNPLNLDETANDTVSTLIYSKLYKQVMALLQDESFGLNNYEKVPPGTFKMMCLFIIHCSNLQQAMIRSADFFDFLDSFTHQSSKTRTPISFTDNKKTAICRFTNPNTPKNESTLQAEASIIYMMHRFYSWLTAKSIPLKEVCFSAPAPDNLDKYQQLFNCPVKYQQKDNNIKLAAEYLQSPIAQTEDSLRDFLRMAPYQLVTGKIDIDLQNVKTRVRLFLEEDMLGSFSSIEDVAQRMNISSRTLHRRLEKENSSFQQIKDDIRRDAAVAYINRPELTISAVSILMGFQDTSAFYRAFKKWTGMSPGDFRKINDDQGRSA